MEKVKLTQEQADAIEYAIKHHNKAELIDCFMGKRGRFVDDLEILHRLTYNKFFGALYIGYEVEPQFKVGDWVTHQNGVVARITSINDKGVITTDHPLDRIRDNGDRAYMNTFPRYFTHSNSKEIAEEKQRRWWAKHDRDVWEIKQGDVLMALRRHIFEVTADPKSHEFGSYTGNDEFDFDIQECKNENWKVICFAENRKDLNDAE